MKKLAKSLITFSIGAAAGTMAGLLLAPNKGSKTRKLIRGQVKKVSMKDDVGKADVIDLSRESFQDESYHKRGIADYIYHS
jgi:gas vesicle protein